jgi:hypothetical protein
MTIFLLRMSYSVCRTRPSTLDAPGSGAAHMPA